MMGYLGENRRSELMRRDFDEFLTRIEEDSDSQSEKGRRFETIIRRAWCEHPIYGSIYSRVQSYRAWARSRGESAQDTGIDLVAEREDGRFAAIQCKFYDHDTPLNLNLVDRFIAASSRPEFVERYFVWTGGTLSEQVNRRLEQVEPRCQLVSRDALAGWGLNWLELYLRPEDEEIRFQKPHTPRDDQEKAIDDVLKGFQQGDRGRLIPALWHGQDRYLALVSGTTGGHWWPSALPRAFDCAHFPKHAGMVEALWLEASVRRCVFGSLCRLRS